MTSNRMDSPGQQSPAPAAAVMPMTQAATVSSGSGRCSCHCEPVVHTARPEIPKVQVKYVPVVVHSAPLTTNRPDPAPASGQMERERSSRDAVPRHQHFPNSQQHKHRDPDFDDDPRHPGDAGLRSSPPFSDYESKSNSGLMGMPNDASEEMDNNGKIPPPLSDAVRYSDTGNSLYDSEAHHSGNQQQQRQQQGQLRLSQQAKQEDSILSDGNRLKQGHRPGNRDSVGEDGERALDPEMGAGSGGGRSISRGSGGRTSGGERGLGGSYGHKQQEDFVVRERGSSSVRGGSRQDRETDAVRGDGDFRTTADWRKSASLPSSASSSSSLGRGRSGGRRAGNSLSTALGRLANKQFVIESTESEIDNFPFPDAPFDVKYLL